jgi:hypothetical protein
MREKGNIQKMENQQLISLSRQFASMPVGFGQRFLTKNSVTTLEHIWLQLIFTYSLDRNEH